MADADIGINAAINPTAITETKRWAHGADAGKVTMEF